MKYILLLFALSSAFHSGEARAERAIKATEYLDQHYGPHEREIFDLWVPKTLKKAPLVIYIHGGGFEAGSKDEIRKRPKVISRYLKKGVAIAAINYRFLKHASIQDIMREDIAGFVQYMRFHAQRYHLNAEKILPYGVSAGGSASLWLATHDDIADSHSEDPIKRESSRVLAAGHLNAQVSYDYTVWYQLYGKEITDHFVGKHVWYRYHLSCYEDIFTELGTSIRKDMDMYGNLTQDDPPILFWNSLSDEPTKDNNHFVHSPRHTRLLSQKAEALGIQHETLIKADDGKIGDPHEQAFQFFMKILGQK